MTDTTLETPCPRPDKKWRFNTLQYAQAARDAINLRTGFDLHIYQCACGQYHLTSQGTDDKTMPVKTNSTRLDTGRTPLAPQDPPLDPHPTTTRYLITPGVAAQWLQNANTHNRALRERHVDALAGAMLRGEWVDNGDPIRFCTQGVLRDGQHRLAAIVQAGRPITAFVTTGLPPQSQITMDTGARRLFADILKLEGYSDTLALAALVNRVYRWESGQVRSVQLKPSHQQLLQILARHPELPDALPAGKRISHVTGLSTSLGAFAWWLFSMISREDAAVFVNRLVDGVGLESGSPILALRRVVLKNAAARAKHPDFVMLAMVIKAWNAYRVGRPMHTLAFKSGGAAPESFPEPE